MSLRIVLLAIGGVFVGWILFWTLLAMGPIAWVVIVPMLIIGLVQVYRKRAKMETAADGVYYCANCGTEISRTTADGERADGPDRELNYCTNCGEPVEIDEREDAAQRVQNCAACGAPNDPDAEACTHCHAAL